MKELIEQEAASRHPTSSMIDAVCRSQFIAGGLYAASLYPCTPDEVKEIREILNEELIRIKMHSPLLTEDRIKINRIEKLLKD